MVQDSFTCTWHRDRNACISLSESKHIIISIQISLSKSDPGINEAPGCTSSRVLLNLKT